MKKLIGITESIILTMAAFTSCGAESGTVSTDGSTSMEKVVGALGEAFMEDNVSISCKSSTCQNKVRDKCGSKSACRNPLRCIRTCGNAGACSCDKVSV